MHDTTIKSTLKKSYGDLAKDTTGMACCVLSEIEDMNGIANDTADVVVSNCVLNLVPEKEEGNCCETTQNGCCVAKPETAPVSTSGCCGANTGKCCG
jgi:hypothetical protein